MDMIIAELHDKSREIYTRAAIVLLSSIKLEGKDALPVLSETEAAAVARLSTPQLVIAEAHALRVEALSLKLKVLENRLSYPTEAALHRRLWRACQATASAMEAEARLLRQSEGETQLYCSLMDESRAHHREAEAHMDLADVSEKKLTK